MRARYNNDTAKKSIFQYFPTANSPFNDII